MKLADGAKGAFAMPLTDPAYPRGPYKFCNREFVVIRYRSDPDALREVVPEPLEVVGDTMCDVARLPVRGVVSASHFVTDLTLGLGEVIHDYLTDS